MFDFGRIWTPNTLIGLGLGQFLSLLITSTGFTSSQLAKKGIFNYYYYYYFFSFSCQFSFIILFFIIVGINAPTSQSFLNYVFLSLVYGTILLYRRKALKVIILFSIGFYYLQIYDAMFLFSLFKIKSVIGLKEIDGKNISAVI